MAKKRLEEFVAERQTDAVERKILDIHSWDSSVTGHWSPETGLHLLRDNSPEELVGWLWDPGIQIQSTAIIEMIAHGCPRKAAEFVRALIKAHPDAEESIRVMLKDMADYFISTPLHFIPGSPSEYPSNIKIRLVN